MHRASQERGAAAVEFALVLPVLVLLLLGIVELGMAFNTQLTLTAAAREGVRVMALSGSPSAARSATIAAAPGLTPPPAAGQIAVTPASCSPGQTATVIVTYPFTPVTSLLGEFTLTARGVMRCGG
jgi:Flp pilus assembly protein TadG